MSDKEAGGTPRFTQMGGAMVQSHDPLTGQPTGDWVRASDADSELAAKERELEQARAALTDIADGPQPIEGYKNGVRCGLEDRDLQSSDAYTAAEYGYDQGLDWCADIARRALKSSPASGEQINAAAPNTAPQVPAAATLPVIPAVEAGQPAAAVPDDPVEVFISAAGKDGSLAATCRAVAAHYEAKGMQRAEEMLKRDYMELLYAVARKCPGETRHQTALRYIRERENMPSNPAAAAKLEDDRG